VHPPIRMQNQTNDNTWVAPQVKSFTKWVNNQLQKKHYPPIMSIVDDFCDGKTLINLLNVIYDEPIEHNKGKLSEFQRRDNIDKAIKFIESKNIDLVSIDADHIFNKNVKLTLGMTWALILRSISQYGCDDASSKNIRSILLKWCRDCTKEYDNVDIKDFTHSWKDGLSFNAIIHHFAPHLVDYYSLSGKNAKENLTNAFDVAEKNFNIPKLLDPEDLTESVVPDEKSVITYVSQYYLKLAELEYKSNIEKGEEHLAKMDEWLRKNMGGYNKLAHEFSMLLQRKNEAETRLHGALAEILQFDASNNLHEKFLKLSSLYGNLRMAFSVLRGKEFETMPEYEPNNLMNRMKETTDMLSRTRIKLKDIAQSIELNSDTLAYVDKNKELLCKKYNSQKDDGVKAITERIACKKENNLSSTVGKLCEEKLALLKDLDRHKEYENYRLETAIKLFKTYDSSDTKYIDEVNFNNCCFVLNLDTDRDVIDGRIHYDDYVQFVKESLKKLSIKSGMACENVTGSDDE
ncbi:Ca2+-binding actin-bundling protein (actinin), alpha chain (EF-Hand protein superfamily), partial [Trachipleistophora hominis]